MNLLFPSSCVANLAPFFADGELVAFDPGFDECLYAVIALEELDYRRVTSSGNFAKAIPSDPQAYRVVAFHSGSVLRDVRVVGERFNIHHVQPLPDDRLLLACGRSGYRRHDDFDKNGRVYSWDGTLQREILLGDGIQDIQTTPEGAIWTSYFDEGVFGNRGWNEPVGSAGLVAWDCQGNKQFEYEPAGGLDGIADCYALNAISESDVWCYYYTDFPLVHVQKKRIHAHWSLPIGGSRAFAIWKQFALFAGGYNPSDEWPLFELGKNGDFKVVASFVPADTNGDRLLTIESVSARFGSLFVKSESSVYRYDLSDAVTGL